MRVNKQEKSKDNSINYLDLKDLNKRTNRIVKSNIKTRKIKNRDLLSRADLKDDLIEKTWNSNVDKSNDKLLKNLAQETFCRIGVSKIPNAGVGVIAIKDIPKGINPFIRCDERRVKDKVVELSEEDLKELHPEVQRLVNDFFLPYVKNGKTLFPVVNRGINGMDISFYLNHSEDPNLDMIEVDKPYYDFKTNRDIKAGEEMLIDYFS